MSLLRQRSTLTYDTLRDGLIARYCPSLQGPAGDKLYDLSGNNYHGAFSGGLMQGDAWERSEGKWSLRFRARFSNENVILPADLLTSMGPYSPMTYSQWFYNRGNFTTYQCLQDGAFSRQVSVFQGPDANTLYFAFRGAAGSASSTPFTMQANTWYHLATTVYENGFVAPFLNGLPCGTLGAGSGDWSAEPIRIGTNNSGGGDGFVGHQDDIAIYNRVLSRAEISTLASERGLAYSPRRRRTLAAPAGIISASATSTIAFTSYATYDLVTLATSRSAESTLAFTQTVSFFLLSDVYQVSHSLGLTDSVVVKGYEYGTDTLSLIQTADFRIGIPVGGYFLTDTINFTEALSRGQNYGVTDNLNLVDSGAHITPTTSSITFTQTVTLSKGKSVTDTILFTQSITSESRFSRTVSNTNILQQAVGYYAIGVDRCGKAKYSRFEGVGEEEGIPIQPRSGNHFPVSFESVTDSPAAVFLRAPEMDDKHRMSFDRVNRETVGGELNVYRDDAWTTTKSMLFTIVGIKTAIFESLQAFMFATLGQEVLFNDWTGVTWKGVVTNPEEAATEDRDGYWTVAFEFEGSPYDGPPANHNMVFSQTASFTIE